MLLLDKLRNLLVMAAADGSLTEREIKFLSDRCRKWEITDLEFANAIQYALSDEAELTIPPERNERLAMLRDLIRMMAADGKMDDVEKEIFAVAAAHMEISGRDLDRLIDSLLADRGGRLETGGRSKDD